jgi:class 3 adenylate cyclase
LYDARKVKGSSLGQSGEEAVTTFLATRVGVSTGEVVVRTIETGGHTEYTPVGHVTNLAARMHTAAPAGSIAASEATMTPHPTAAWTLQQPHEAIRSDHTYRFILHDRDLEGQTAAIEEFESPTARACSPALTIVCTF